MLRPYRNTRDRRLPHADHIFDQEHQVLRRRIICIDLTRHPPDARRTIRIDRETADRQVPTPEHAARAREREELAAHQHGYAAYRGHTGAASSGSDSDPPGTIMGKTLASCSITSSTSAGPRASFASRSTSRTSAACLTRHPGIPYAAASFT